MIEQRLNTFDEKHCWQYDIRVKNLKDDLEEAGLTKEYTESLRIKDFEFKVLTKRKEQKMVRDFIERHEWLGKVCGFSKYYFSAWHKNILAGVIIMGVPNAYNMLLGKENRDLELLINRGACISWSPKNLASSLMSYSINWVVKNTPYRLFTAYSDPTAKELGTIYQACNFYYLGNNYGASKKYIQPYNGQMVSDRWFRTRCAYKNYAKELGIKWESHWLGKGRKVNWDKVKTIEQIGLFQEHNKYSPEEIESVLREYSKKKQAEARFIEIPAKHKYAYVLGKDNRETKLLRNKFLELNTIYNYPKERGS